MFPTRKHLVPATAASLLLALSATALLAHSGKTMSGPVSCEILATAKGGMITLQGVVHAETALDGTYDFRVASVGGAGSSDISQGGGFSAAPGRPAELGQVTLGGSGAVYEATLEVDTSAGRVTCTKRAGAL